MVLLSDHESRSQADPGATDGMHLHSDIPPPIRAGSPELPERLPRRPTRTTAAPPTRSSEGDQGGGALYRITILVRPGRFTIINRFDIPVDNQACFL
jgi:hypothetical protein